MRVCVVGSGGREHALAHVLGRDAEVVVTPGNPGIPGSVATPPAEIDADLFVVGSEAPLVDGLADRLALIDPDLLSANKRVINLGMELMGAQVLQRLAAENDARGHRAPGTKAYFAAVKEKGLREAFRERDSKFGDGRARVSGPEIRDEEGRLIDS